MGNSLSDYRLSIGLYNNVKIVTSYMSIGVRSVSIICIIICLMLLLLLVCGDVELNLGPAKLKSLSICHVNIRGLSENKILAIKNTLSDKFDIITLSETFLSANSSTDLHIPGFHAILRRDRPSFGGGIAVYIRDNIIYKRCYDKDSLDVENMWIEVNTCEGKLLICNIYRPPNVIEFWDYLASNIELVKSERCTKNIMLSGDFNADFKTSNGKKLLDFCNVHNFVTHINEPTRITSETQSCLDQIVSNISNNIYSVSVQAPVSTNDHCTIGVELKFKIVSDPAYYRHCWLYDQGDYVGFRNALETNNWEHYFETEDVNVACGKWSECFLNIASVFIPNKTTNQAP